MIGGDINNNSSAICPQAAITGMGLVSCLGRSLDDVAKALQEGKSGIISDPQRANRGFRSSLTTNVSEFDDKKIPRRHRRSMCEPALYAYNATKDAIEDANLAKEHLQNDRCGIVFGNDSCIKASVESIDILRETGETHFIGAGYIFRSMNSTVSMNLAGAFGIRGANWTLSAACASGAHAIGQALMLIRSGMQDIVLTGGAQESNWQSTASFDALGVFSTRHDNPAKACRPFDANRDGLVPGSGAACLVIENIEHARKRKARIYGIISGYGFASAGCRNPSHGSSESAARSMKNALQNASVQPDEIDYINAHATSTQIGDHVEACGIAEVFGQDTPVSSTKSMTGHECWMAGASEVVYTTLMARDNFIAPNLNFKKLDKNTPQINVINQTAKTHIRQAVSNSFGFGGTNATLVLDYRNQL